MDKSILSQASQHEERNILAEVCNLAAARDDVIDLSVGDPNFATPLPGDGDGGCGTCPLVGPIRLTRSG